MKLQVYEIESRFGTLQYATDEGIDAARAWAKAAHGLVNPQIKVQREVTLCDRCDSNPCCCPKKENQ